MTANDGIGERERCIAAGASDFISKPIDMPKLLATIQKRMPIPGAVGGD